MVKIYFVLILGVLTNVAIGITDEPFSQRMVYDASSNMVVEKGEEGRHIQTFSNGEEYIFVEAEEMLACGSIPHLEWSCSKTGHPTLLLLPSNSDLSYNPTAVVPFLSGHAVATVTPSSTTDTIHKNIVINKPGKYAVFVRYQTTPNLPAPFIVSVEQSGTLLLKKEIDKTSKALDRLGPRMLWEKVGECKFTNGQAVLKLTKPKDIVTKNSNRSIASAGTRFVDCFMITNNLNYIPAGAELLGGKLSIDNRISSLKVKGKNVLVWKVHRYDYFNVSSWPKDTSQIVKELQFSALRNDHCNDRILLTSLMPKSISFSTDVSIDNFKGSVEVFVVGFMQSRYFGWVPHVLFRRDKITVCPYHTVGLWIAVRTGPNTPPGKYTGVLKLKTETGNLLTCIPIKISVFSGCIQHDNNLNVLLWGDPIPQVYPPTLWKKFKRLYWENALRFGWNVFKCKLPWTAEQAKKMGIKPVVFVSGSKDVLRKQVERYRKLGYLDEQMWFEAFDEPSERSCQKWISRVKEAKEVSSNIKIWINPGWQKYQTVECFKRWSKYVDIWWPFEGNLAVPELLKIMRESGKPIGFYIERGWSGFNPASAWVYFRRMPMIVAKYGINGCGFWSADVYYREPWNDFNTQINYSKAAVFYPGNNGPINTINFYAWREGLDDLFIVQAIAKQGSTDANSLARQYLSIQSPEGLDNFRINLLRMMK